MFRSTSATPALRGTRWLLIVFGGMGAGLILAFCVVGSGEFDVGSMGAGQDARAYWRAVRVFPYGPDAGEYGAYLYSPAFVQVLSPLLNLPWQQFLAGWTGLLIATLLLLTGPVLFVIALPLAFFEIWGGNIHLLLALAIVLGFRWPAAWLFVLLTKVTPGVGLIWFAVRREWRALAIASAATLAVVFASVVSNPYHWQAWIALLLREATGNPTPPGAIAIPFPIRLPVAVALAIYAARTDRRWLVPVVAMLALPVLWWGSLSLLVGSVALERRRLEVAITSGLGALRGRWLARAQRPTWSLGPEPES
jgi:hypothetical protein